MDTSPQSDTQLASDAGQQRQLRPRRPLLSAPSSLPSATAAHAAAASKSSSSSAASFVSSALPNRKALVMGNRKYAARVGRLKCSGKDIESMSEAVSQLGFQCTLLLDASKKRMTSALRTFVASLRRGDTVFLYFSSHGEESAGTTYLLPSDFGVDDSLRDDAEPTVARSVVAGVPETTDSALTLLCDRSALRWLPSTAAPTVPPAMGASSSAVSASEPFGEYPERTLEPGVTYRGEVSPEGKLHGRGRIQAVEESGDRWVYEGSFKDGMRDGVGVLSWEDGGHYQGEFTADQRCGLGAQW